MLLEPGGILAGDPSSTSISTKRGGEICSVLARYEYGAVRWPLARGIRGCAGAGTEVADVGAGAWLPGEGCGARTPLP
ncbi:hypothetical protein V6Z11_A11G109400 [Gossypium hirsutum]